MVSIPRQKHSIGNQRRGNLCQKLKNVRTDHYQESIVQEVRLGGFVVLLVWQDLCTPQVCGGVLFRTSSQWLGRMWPHAEPRPQTIPGRTSDSSLCNATNTLSRKVPLKTRTQGVCYIMQKNGSEYFASCIRVCTWWSDDFRNEISIFQYKKARETQGSANGEYFSSYSYWRVEHWFLDVPFYNTFRGPVIYNDESDARREWSWLWFWHLGRN